MRFICGALITSGVIALVIFYQDFKKMKAQVGLTPYTISFECSQWLHPTESFYEYLQVIQKRMTSRSRFEFFSLDSNGGSPVAYSAKNSVGFMNNGYFYQDSDYTVVQTYTDVKIGKASPKTKNPFSLFLSKTARQNLLVSLTKIKNGYQVIFYENQTPVTCELTSQKATCAGDSWKNIQAVSPKARNGIDVFCQNNEHRLKSLEETRTEFGAQCKSDLSFDLKFKFPCDLIKGR